MLHRRRSGLRFIVADIILTDILLRHRLLATIARTKWKLSSSKISYRLWNYSRAGFLLWNEFWWWNVFPSNNFLSILFYFSFIFICAYLIPLADGRNIFEYIEKIDARYRNGQFLIRWNDSVSAWLFMTKGMCEEVFQADGEPLSALTRIALHETMKLWFPSVMPARQYSLTHV
jgi:hypothetical protein